MISSETITLITAYYDGSDILKLIGRFEINKGFFFICRVRPLARVFYWTFWISRSKAQYKTSSGSYLMRTPHHGHLYRLCIMLNQYFHWMWQTARQQLQLRNSLSSIAVVVSRRHWRSVLQLAYLERADDSFCDYILQLGLTFMYLHLRGLMQERATTLGPNFDI